MTEIAEFPSFTYNYVDMDFDLVDVLPKNSLCRISMRAGNYTYEEFPFFYHLYLDRQKTRDDVAEEKSKDQVPGADNKERDAAFGEAGFSLGFPANFTLKFKPIVVTQSIRTSTSGSRLSVPRRR